MSLSLSVPRSLLRRFTRGTVSGYLTLSTCRPLPLSPMVSNQCFAKLSLNKGSEQKVLCQFFMKCLHQRIPRHPHAQEDLRPPTPHSSLRVRRDSSYPPSISPAVCPPTSLITFYPARDFRRYPLLLGTSPDSYETPRPLYTRCPPPGLPSLPSVYQSPPRP